MNMKEVKLCPNVATLTDLAGAPKTRQRAQFDRPQHLDKEHRYFTYSIVIGS
jgi:hypothetical protein